MEVMPPSSELPAHELSAAANKALLEIVFPVIQALQWNHPIEGLETHFFSQDMHCKTPISIRHPPHENPGQESTCSDKSVKASSTSKVQQGPILSPLDCFTQQIQSTSRAPWPKESKCMEDESSAKDASPEDLIDKPVYSRPYRPKEKQTPKFKSFSSTTSKKSIEGSEKRSAPPTSRHPPSSLIEKTTPSGIAELHSPSFMDSKENERDPSEKELSWEEEEGISSTAKTSAKADQVAISCFQSMNMDEDFAVKNISSFPVLELLQQDSEVISEILNKRTSHFDILLIFMALMKLEIESQEEEKLARRAERAAQLHYLEKEVSNLRAQSKSLLFAHVGAGLLGVVSGFSPIIGYMKGDGILKGLSSVFTSLDGMKKKDFFDNISKITMSISETQKASGQIYGTFAEGDRTKYNRYGELHGRDQEERTRCMEQLQERCRQMERFLLDLLQMRHDVTSQLYR